MAALSGGVARVRLRKAVSNIIFLNLQQYNNSTRMSSTITIAKSLISERRQKILPQISNIMKQYEDVIGLTEVREAQARVVEAQRKFVETQEQRRERQQQIQTLQVQLKEIHADLDKTSRGEDRYLHLITREHAVIKQEKQQMEEFTMYEKAEREYFTLLSSAVRESHEKERSHAERTKYWSIIGSVCGAVIGIVGTTVNNWLRMKELRGIVHESTTAKPVVLHGLVNELSDTAKKQHNEMSLFIADLKSMLGNNDTTKLKAGVIPGANQQATVSSKTNLEEQTNQILAVVRQQESNLKSEMRDIKSLIGAASRGAAAAVDGESSSAAAAAIYIGKDVEQLMKDAEQNLEWKMKLNALATVVTVYGALALTVPLLFKIFGGA